MKNITYNIVQWSTPEELHAASVDWLSQLQFIRHEQHFLNKLITYYSTPLVSAKTYDTTSSIVENLQNEEKKLKELISRVKNHTNHIESVLDKYSDPRENDAFRETHYYLKITIFKYTEDYRKTKGSLFDKIKEIMKEFPPKTLTN